MGQNKKGEITPKGLEVIKFGKVLIAVIIRTEYQAEGITFFTPSEFSQQLAYIKHRKGHTIEPHIHNLVPREVKYTQEVLFVKKGKVKVDLYTHERRFLQSVVLKGGDTILLASGGHGFKMLEPTEMIEVKQGPYAGERDKTKFKGYKKDDSD